MFTVVNTNDSGPGSLRQAILNANSNPGLDMIDFQIPGPGVHTIQPVSPLPSFMDTAGAVLDGATQPGFVGTPLIELDGSLAGGGADGLVITSRHTTVRSLVINRFSNRGVVLSGNGNNVIQGNYIGTDASGRIARGNGSDGILIFQGSHDNLIGTDGDGINDAAERNVISANGFEGVFITDPGADRNVIAGNYIGTDVSGTRALANGESGIWIQFGPQANRIGVSSADPDYAAEGNLIAGNGHDGVTIRGIGTDQNVVAGNYIGTDATGTRDLGNANSGVAVFGGAQFTRIGTDGDGVADDAERNLISGNRQPGVYIADSGTNSNVVAGNYIGTDATGTAPLGNGLEGVQIVGGAKLNRVGTDGDGVADDAERNLISANRRRGVLILDSGTDQNVVAGNYIGTDATGTRDLGNLAEGVLIWNGPKDNRIGTGGTAPDAAGEGNLISANSGDGVGITSSGTDRNVVAGNFIGTDVTGTRVLGNGGQGVAIYGGAQANRIGTDGDGVGDTVERNLISGNRNWGVAIGDRGTDQNVVAGNYIGTNATGTLALGNRGTGVIVRNGAQANRIGVNSSDPDFAAESNLISGNRIHGVLLADPGTDHNIVAGNYIGTTADGTAVLPNGWFAVQILGGAKFNVIGATGDSPAAQRNVISGNALAGVSLVDAGTEQNVVAGNYIGTDATGTVALGNSWFGVQLEAGVSRNRIGGNLISGNGLGGVLISDRGTDLNVVAGNYIGTDATGNGSLGNFGSGVVVRNGPLNNTIGGEGVGEGNVIAHNLDGGVVVNAATRTSILHNTIFDHPNGRGIWLLNGGNNNQAFPVLTSATATDFGMTVQGGLRSTPSTTFVLEFFANSVCHPSGFGEGELFDGSWMVTTDPDGNTSFSAPLPTVPVGWFVTATATDPAGDTSEFSACVLVTPGTAPGGSGAGHSRRPAEVAPALVTRPVSPVVSPPADGTHSPSADRAALLSLSPATVPEVWWNQIGRTPAHPLGRAALDLAFTAGVRDPLAPEPLDAMDALRQETWSC